ncbi:DUF6318 family protein [Cellulomonas timonensis]|uniref:DUF6318 family protein n=1 Tax=Cellulomonas timonensis TaxID=1689271 RepID=UPI000A60F2AB|nr:DUF6318 family protein [Cellulomonas timonensis]
MIPSPRSLPDVRETHRRRPPAVWAAAAALAISLGLTACTDEDRAPLPSPTGTDVVATPTPTPTPSPTRSPKPERPTAMDEVSVEGAIAAATYFVELYPYVYNTGDLAEWNALSHPECLTCTGIATKVEEMHGLGQRIEGAAISVADVSGVELIPGSSFSVEMQMTQGPTTVKDSAGNTQSEQLKSVTSKPLLIVVHESDRWLIRALENQAPDA